MVGREGFLGEAGSEFSVRSWGEFRVRVQKSFGKKTVTSRFLAWVVELMGCY